VSNGQRFVPMQYSSDFSKLLETLLKDSDHPAPDWFKAQVWMPFDKEFALSNLSNSDIKALLHQYRAVSDILLLSMPPRSLDWTTWAQIEQGFAKLLVKSKRSKEGFERKQLTTSRTIYTPQPQSEDEKKKGWF